jgi:hypothetical protein
MQDLPVLSEATKRKLELQWETVRDKQKLKPDEVSDYDKERQRLLRMPANPPSHVRPLRPHWAARDVGLIQSVRAAEARFRGIDSEYWSHWCSSGLGYEVYRDWLDSVTRQVPAELASIWKGRSVVTDQWFDSTCAPAIGKALAVLLKQRIAQARDVETKRLERPSPARTGTGNPVADEILARANDPESMRRLIESGDDSLSPPAQRAIQLARTRMKAQSPDALIDIYISDQWRIHGGPSSRLAGEELRDRLIPVVIKGFGSLESCLDILLKESPCSNGRQIKNLTHACELFFLRMHREAFEADDQAKVEIFAKLCEEFHELCDSERKHLGPTARKDEEIHATLRTDLCRLQAYEIPPRLEASSHSRTAAKSEGDQSRIQVPGPDDAELLIYPAGDIYTMWSVWNRGLASIEQFQLEICSTQSFDVDKRAFREPRSLNFQWPAQRNVGAGDKTKAAIFLRVDGDDLRLFNSDDTPVLHWPNGDESVMRRWRLSMKVTGLSNEWLVALDLSWAHGTKRVEFSPIDDSLPIAERQALEEPISLNKPERPLVAAPILAPYPMRAAWFQNELALREWNVHEFQAQGGPDWKTSRKILDGLSVSRVVLEKTAAALSRKKRRVLFGDIPQE